MNLPLPNFSVENGKVTKQDIIDYYAKFGVKILEVEFVADTIVVKLATALKFIPIDICLENVKVTDEKAE